MKPVVIFRHALTEGPGFLGTFLTEKNIPWRLVKIDQGETLPDSMLGFSGVVLMGGPMSVNDERSKPIFRCWATVLVVN